jgi:hypothetical protein
VNHPQHPAPSSPRQPCRHGATLHRPAALPARPAPPVAPATALTPAPLAGTAPVAAPVSTRLAGPPINAFTGSRTTVQAGAIGIDKYPRDAGD